MKSKEEESKDNEKPKKCKWGSSTKKNTVDISSASLKVVIIQIFVLIFFP